MASVSEDKGFEQEPKQVDAVPDDDTSLLAKGTPKNIKLFLNIFRKQLLTFGFRLNRGGGEIDFERHRNFGITFSSSCTRGVRPYLFRAPTNFLIHFGYICNGTYSP